MDHIELHQEFSRADGLGDRFQDVRYATEALAAELTEEDQCVQ